MTSKLALQWLPCQAPGVLGSALGLVGPVSVYCDWVRWRVGSATSISVWQHFYLCVSATCVLGSSPLSLWIPDNSLSGDVAGRLPEGAANPTPLSPTDMWGH